MRKCVHIEFSSKIVPDIQDAAVFAISNHENNMLLDKVIDNICYSAENIINEFVDTRLITPMHESAVQLPADNQWHEVASGMGKTEIKYDGTMYTVRRTSSSGVVEEESVQTLNEMHGKHNVISLHDLASNLRRELWLRAAERAREKANLYTFSN